MFDSEPIDKEMWEHVAECEKCRRLYDEYCAAVNYVTPKAPIAIPSGLGSVVPTHRRRHTRTPRYLSWAAMVAAVVLLAGLAFHQNTSSRAVAASQSFGNASFAMNNVENFSATIFVRTRPQDNFDFIDPSLPFVEHHLSVMLHNGKKLWRLDKGGEHFVVCDGNAQYQWWKHSTKATISPIDCNIIYHFAMLVNIATLMEYEKLQAEQTKGNSYTVTHTDSTLTLHIKSKRQTSPHPLLGGSHSFGQADNEREYIFDAASHRLLQMRYWVTDGEQKQLILESRNFDYGNSSRAAEITSLPTKGIEWLDTRIDMDITPDRLALLQQEQPEDAARRILTSIFDKDSTGSCEALRLYDTRLLFDKWNGYTLIGCKEVIHSEGYSGVYAVMEALSPRKEHKTIVAAMRNDNPLKIWIIDGGI